MMYPEYAGGPPVPYRVIALHANRMGEDYQQIGDKMPRDRQSSSIAPRFA
tara:strand:+ start:985 stop:1134 length:150 start_codon:yes stop_codon:yes gene_type:complete